MLETNSKVYLVSEFGGEYEDKWDQPIGVCSSLELAEKLKSEILANREIKTNISLEKYEEMLDYLYEYEDKHGAICKEESEGIKKLFPDYNPEDIDAVDKVYFSYNDFGGVDITEINFYN